ncbi:putative MFS family arabinose efflux permease [Chitinophaga dinghuensis]|uniref:Putative MFS family arabinose efflux permease n=1 Tax=Chitinophaga dinghuensis TaxID=1539050 RepID=A0A327VVL5_9BACT|nr:MFS transporter [Chitinophaga dinghuensis]RAJ80041.1 putative MFS family arabinose efflux permease [Chitinophaga dinghuensis]
MELALERKAAWGIPVMAASAGIIVANLYYNQPILHNIAQSIHASESSIGKMSMMAQLGYGLGMLFLVPLGDKMNRKNLIISTCILLAVTLLLTATAHSANALLALSFFTGLFSTPAQIILPMAAALGKENRGKTVGKVYSGILTGILGSRVLSGIITSYWGWQYVFVISAVLVVFAILLLSVYLPEVPPKFKGNYFKLLGSTLGLIKEYRILRQAAILGAFTFGVFCSFWTTLTFHLSTAPLNYSTASIGLFGLVAIGGALVAPVFGKIADRGNVFRGLYLSVAMMAGSILLLKMFPFSATALIAGIFFLDIGVQATQITNFTRIYALNEHAHSRLNTVYMTTYFIGAAIGTGFGLMSWKMGGWNMATWQMLIWSLIALMIVFISQRNSRNNTSIIPE